MKQQCHAITNVAHGHNRDLNHGPHGLQQTQALNAYISWSPKDWSD